MRNAILLSALVFGLSVFGAGGNEVGNGGGGVSCHYTTGQPDTLRFLDFYVGVELLKFPIDLGDAKLDEEQKVEFALNRLNRLDPTRASRYRTEAQEFFNNVLFVDKALLPDTNDFGEIPLPRECEIVQVCIQKQSVLPDVKRYTIQRDLWARLSKEHRAGLILHEIIYREALAKGHKDSRMTRYLNALVSSSKIDSLTQAEYNDRIEKSGFGVKTGPMAPLWAADPIRLPPAHEGVFYQASLASYLLGTGPITVSALQVPGWLYLGFDGELRGTPPVASSLAGTVKLVVKAVGFKGQTAETNVWIPVLD